MDFQNAMDAYGDFIRQLVDRQVVSIKLALGKITVRHIFVDGGFSKNEIFMTLLAKALPELEVYAAELAQASALGAVVVMYEYWNTKP